MEEPVFPNSSSSPGDACLAGDEDNDTDDDSPIEEVRLTVTKTDDPTLPVWTFRMWLLGLISCAVLSFTNQFFSYRTEPLILTQITVVIAVLPIGHFMAATLPTKTFRIRGFGEKRFSLNPGPFNVKEHVLISIFANAGFAFGIGNAYAVEIVDIIKVYYHRKISFLVGWLLTITTQVLGYGFAGIFRKYVVEPGHMWWPASLVQVSVFRVLHEKEERRFSGAKFFVIALICSFSWYVVPGYLFPTITSISWICWAFPKSVTAHQLGSGLSGLGVGALTLDWNAVSAFLGNPLVTPFFAIVNIFVGYFPVVFIIVPLAYWKFDWYGARTFPIFSSDLFTSRGQNYDISAIVNEDFELNLAKYEEMGQLHMSMFFALMYGVSFAAVAATLTHVTLFYGREIYQRLRASHDEKEDIHTKLMRKYKDIPSWWFHTLTAVSIGGSLLLCIVFENQVQMPWLGLVFACALGFICTLPISIITATTNQWPGMDVVILYVMGLVYPGKPIAVVCLKIYGYMSMAQAVSFLNDFKLGHYMKIPPRSMFIVQFAGTIIAGTINLGVAWWLLTSIKDICNINALAPDSPWTCPNDKIFFDESVLWGLLGTKRNFGSLGPYGSMNWFFLGGALAPAFVWLLHKAFPRQTWIPLINFPVLLGSTSLLFPATPLNYNVWIIVGTIFNFFVFRYRKKWWQRYNYILAAALDAGVAFMTLLLYFALGMSNKGISWWGTGGDHCDLSACPVAKGIQVDGCPVH